MTCRLTERQTTLRKNRCRLHDRTLCFLDRSALDTVACVNNKISFILLFSLYTKHRFTNHFYSFWSMASRTYVCPTKLARGDDANTGFRGSTAIVLRLRSSSNFILAKDLDLASQVSNVARRRASPLARLRY